MFWNTLSVLKTGDLSGRLEGALTWLHLKAKVFCLVKQFLNGELLHKMCDNQVIWLYSPDNHNTHGGVCPLEEVSPSASIGFAAPGQSPASLQQVSLSAVPKPCLWMHSLLEWEVSFRVQLCSHRSHRMARGIGCIGRQETGSEKSPQRGTP